MDSIGNKTPVNTNHLQPAAAQTQTQPQTPQPSLYQRFKLRRSLANAAQLAQKRQAPLPLAPVTANYLQALPAALTGSVINPFLNDDERRTLSQVNRAANLSVNSDAAFVWRNYRAKMKALKLAQLNFGKESAERRHTQSAVARKLDHAAEALANKTGVAYQSYTTRQNDTDAQMIRAGAEWKSVRRNYVVHSIHMLSGRERAGVPVPHFAAILKLQDLLGRWDGMSAELRLKELLAAEEQLVGVSDQVSTDMDTEINGVHVQGLSGSALDLHNAIWQLTSMPGYQPALRYRLEQLQIRLIDLALQDLSPADDRPVPSLPAQNMVQFHDAPSESGAANDPWYPGKRIVCAHTDRETGAISTKSEAWPEPKGHTDYVRLQFPSSVPGQSFVHVFAVNQVSVMEEPDG